MKVSPQRLIIPLLISFSLTASGVILIYFLNKKKDEEENALIKKSEENSVEVKIPRQFVPLVIGRGGTVIQNIKQSTGTNINFKEERDVDLLERVCVITGKPENIKLAAEKIQCILNNQPIIETYETCIPQRTIIKITERNSEILEQIQNSSNAKIIFETSLAITDSDTKRRVIIKGTAEQIANALLQIEDKVREDNEQRAKAETTSHTRVPRIKTSPISTPDRDSSTKDADYSKEIFGNQGNEGMMEVFVCGMESPSQFYIQVIGPTNAKLDDLVKDMTDYYAVEENKELHALTSISPGQIVAAKFNVDNKWYRAEVVADLGNQKYDVYYVDFGDREKVDAKNIYELRTDFLSLRLQAIECSLAGVKPREGDWSLEAGEAFSELSALATWKPRVAKIRGYKERTLGCGPSRREGSPIPCIELYEKRDDQLISISKELIKLDLAVAENEPWSAASSTLSLSRRSQDASRGRSPEVLVVPAANGVADKSIEEINLTLSPKKTGNVEVIDLISPGKNESTTPTTKVNDTRSFLEYERNSPMTRNGNSNGNNKPHKNLRPNPFKRETKPVVVTQAYPAGYESELSDDDDCFEFN